MADMHSDVRFRGKRIEDLTREEAIAALRQSLAHIKRMEWRDSNHLTSRDVLEISETLRDQTKKAWPIKFDGAGDLVKAPDTPPVTVSVEGGIGGEAGGNTYVSGTTVERK